MRTCEGRPKRIEKLLEAESGKTVHLYQLDRGERTLLSRVAFCFFGKKSSSAFSEGLCLISCLTADTSFSIGYGF